VEGIFACLHLILQLLCPFFRLAHRCLSVSFLCSCSGDHTVKITSCHTGTLSRVLTGHRRTPWVVRFHPRNATLLASGSLDHEVRLWDATTGQCIAKHTFGKPIASLAFHVSASVLAIACGHKLFIWEYFVAGAMPVIVLRTRRSMRAVHFHPHGLPVVLTAEVQDPSPTNQLPETLTEDKAFIAASAAWQIDPLIAAQRQHQHEQAAVAATEDGNVEMEEDQPQNVGNNSNRAYAVRCLPPSMVPIGREVPFPALVPAPLPSTTRGAAGASERLAALLPRGRALGTTDISAAINTGGGGGGLLAQLDSAQVNAAYANAWNLVSEEQPPRVLLRLWQFDATKPGAEFNTDSNLRFEVPDAVLCSEMGVHFSPCGTYLAATMACKGPFPEAAAAAAVAAAAAMGAGGRNAQDMDWVPSQPSEAAAAPDPLSYVAPRVVPLPHDEQPSTPPHRPPPASTSAPLHPSSHPMPVAERVVFEVRVMSMNGPCIGEVVRARRVRAAHCLTSVQFSPTGGHLLLAYGKKHSSLLRSLVMDQGTLMPLHTILEVVTVKDMSLMRVLPSVEDEINAACFHPAPGGGIAYGTKEGKLRVISAERAQEDEQRTGDEERSLSGAAAAAAAATVPVVLLEQGYMLLQQQLARDIDLRERMQREHRGQTRAAHQGGHESQTEG
jgi:WD domain, G-beta repeat